MSFTTPFFFLFLPLVLLLYWLLPKRFRYALLLSASALFYGWEAPWLLVLIGIVILTSYVCALLHQNVLSSSALWFVWGFSASLSIEASCGIPCFGCFALSLIKQPPRALPFCFPQASLFIPSRPCLTSSTSTEGGFRQSVTLGIMRCLSSFFRSW